MATRALLDLPNLDPVSPRRVPDPSPRVCHAAKSLAAPTASRGSPSTQPSPRERREGVGDALPAPLPGDSVLDCRTFSIPAWEAAGFAGGGPSWEGMGTLSGFPHEQN
jgi:hypothetical protein